MKKRKFAPIPFVLGILFLICSIAFVTSGIGTHREYETIKDNLISIPATVSSISVLEDSEGADTYTACVTYTYESVTYTDKWWQSMLKGEYTIGQEVTITINPSAPELPYTYPGSPSGHIWGAIGFFAIGIGMIAFSSYLKKNENAPESAQE